MDMIFGVPTAALAGQTLVSLINGAFYAMLSLGLAIIFGILRIVNFAHGAQYMLGAFLAWFMLDRFEISYWWALVAAPVVVGLFGILIERVFLQHLYKFDHVYSLLLTIGIAQIVEGLYRVRYGVSGNPYPNPMSGGFDIGISYLPAYRVWVVVAAAVVCFATWFFIERTKIGSYMRAANENPALLRTFGVNVPIILTLTYGLGAALAGFSGVMAAPIYQVGPEMGESLLIVVFAVVVTGGMGSLGGAIITGFLFGLIEGMTKLFFPSAAGVILFVLMILTLLLRPDGLFGRRA
ncbi:amino acid/amide ABC transporter membrane protein 1 (HAAT family) [Paraburkholderia unamae]|uniref:Amino acid/amide ABC transporter membrane protein 1 (HAAT family) n=2 Tax=Paraburkholderia unamae TaxID=219649 RepID=A0ABX5KWK4_9BURK|nr:branched-chain amino acid ABC transporter permease [Paraburkholderia unamae]PVX84940.1 amino acid/amide ABC transporter membrane protein 1 (HAAT family) [Paraburkholderia unamae]CAG9266696.1 Branched-chain amino acid transport system permease protein [Paraburkholderia unamae]